MDKSFTLEQLLLPGVIDHIIETSVWSASSLTEVPEIELTNWQVMQLPHGDRHFVGWNATEREGRVSSMIVEFDAATRRGRTRSGRIYQLRGPTGHDGDGAYTWGRWMQRNGAVGCTDVSAEVQTLIDPAARDQGTPR